VQQLLLWESNRYYIFWVCACSLRYPACLADAPYCHPWPFWLYHLFPPCLKKEHDFRKKYTGCPTRYRTRHFFNNSNTNEDIVTKFEQEYVRCVRNEKECVCSAPNCCDTEQRSASQPGSVASGTRGILDKKCLFWFSLQLLPETSVILRITERDIINIVVSL